MKNNNKKLIALMMALMLLVGAAVGGTVAYLAAKTDPVVNTFTAGNINIELDESDELDLTMVPGKVIAKDPCVTVKANSEACWLFVKVDESENFDDFMSYTIATGWSSLTGETGVYYREVGAATSDTAFYVLAGDTNNANGIVNVNTTVTKEALDALGEEGAAQPSLTFTAYAVQQLGITDVADAWTEAKKLDTSSTN